MAMIGSKSVVVISVDGLAMGLGVAVLIGSLLA
jgi:hypothetical protein